MKVCEVGFRVYDKEAKEYNRDKEVLLSSDNKIYRIHTITGELQQLKDESLEVEFWIGLRDLDNVKIYEGDIVSFEADSHDMGIIGITGEVAFKNGRFIIKGYEKMFPHYSFYDYVLKDKGIKIIGNIHENPELLGDEE